MSLVLRDAATSKAVPGVVWRVDTMWDLQNYGAVAISKGTRAGAAYIVTKL